MTSNGNKEGNEKKQENKQQTDTNNKFNWLKDFITNNKEMIIFASIGIFIFIIIIIGLYKGGGALLESLKYTEVARGLITFLVTFTTVSIALLLALYALCSTVIGH